MPTKADGDFAAPPRWLLPAVRKLLTSELVRPEESSPRCRRAAALLLAGLERDDLPEPTIMFLKGGRVHMRWDGEGGRHVAITVVARPDCAFEWIRWRNGEPTRCDAEPCAPRMAWPVARQILGWAFPQQLRGDHEL